MSIIKAFTGALGGTFADQWKEIITAGRFDEHTVVAPGVLQQPGNNRGSYNNATPGVLSNGSKIFVPENTAAFIFNQSGIEDIITTPGGYEYQEGQESVFSGDEIKKSIFDQVKDRISYGGQTPEQKLIAFVNLREIRDIKFGTRGPLIYNDSYYETDLEILAFGSFSLKVTEPEIFIRNYVPPNVTFYSFDIPDARAQILSEFIQSFTVALNSLSDTYRVAQLPSQANEVSARISTDSSNAGTWKERFGFEVVGVGIENIEFSPDSKELVKQYSSRKMDWKVLDDISQDKSNIAAQQKIARGVQDHGLGDMPGMVFGMGMVQGLNPQTAAPIQQAATSIQQQAAASTQQPTMSIDEQMEALKKMKELLDAGILTQGEFDIKKKEVMGL